MDEKMLLDLLPVYYKRLFPYKSYYRWLSCGNAGNYFSRREFSFTLKNDIYLRYLSFGTADEFEKEVLKKCPVKIDIGAVFTSSVKDRRTAAEFQPIEKELVFDVDMTDYDDVRYCCSGADMCKKCWPFMVIAIKVIDATLREDFGFDHLLWVYSGRRGVHCWVCDDGARKLATAARAAVVNYLTVVVGGRLSYVNVAHPFLKRSLSVIEKHFEELHVTNQDFLSNRERCRKIVGLVKNMDLRAALENGMERHKNSSERWQYMKTEVCRWVFSLNGPRWKQQSVIEEIMLLLCHPRLDVNVTKGLNHLLKGPFCIHPKTGRVCVPININSLDTFNPFTVPSISLLVDEIDCHDEDMQMISAGANAPQEKVKDYKNTSLCRSIEVFKDFLKKLHVTRSGKLIAESGEKLREGGGVEKDRL